MNNQEILDEDQINNGKEVINKRTKKPLRTSIFYLVSMLMISRGHLYFEYLKPLFNPPFSFYINSAIQEIILCFVVSSILEFFRFLVRKLKKKDHTIIKLIDPFWFQITEGAFAIWIIMTVVKLIVFMAA